MAIPRGAGGYNPPIQQAVSQQRQVWYTPPAQEEEEYYNPARTIVPSVTPSTPSIAWQPAYAGMLPGWPNPQVSTATPKTAWQANEEYMRNARISGAGVPAGYGGYGMIGTPSVDNRYAGYGMLGSSAVTGSVNPNQGASLPNLLSAQKTGKLSNKVPEDEKNTVENFYKSRFTNTSLEEMEAWKDYINTAKTVDPQYLKQPDYLSPAVAQYLGVSEEDRVNMGYARSGVWDEKKQMYVFPLVNPPTKSGSGYGYGYPRYYGGGGGSYRYTSTPSAPWWYWASVNWRI